MEIGNLSKGKVRIRWEKGWELETFPEDLIINGFCGRLRRRVRMVARKWGRDGIEINEWEEHVF